MRKIIIPLAIVAVVAASVAALSPRLPSGSSVLPSSANPKQAGTAIPLSVPLLYDRNRPIVDSRGRVQVEALDFRPASPDASFDPSGRIARPEHVRGIYLTGWVAGLGSRVQDLVNLIDTTELNSMVIDVKDDDGALSFKTAIPLAYQIGSNVSKIGDINSLMSTLKSRKIYTIARVVAFKDQVLPHKRPDLAVRAADGSVFRDRAGFVWADPYSKVVWDYNIAVAKEAARVGFSEVQFDYVRFPDVHRSLKLSFPSADERPKAQVIRDFLAYAREQLAPTGVKISADIFGLVSTVKDDLGIGQHLESLGEVVDYLSPMVYPSHYANGEYGIGNPDASPYITVYKSLRDADRRLQVAKAPAKLVPWLQDFSLRHRYGAAEVRAQIQAAQDLGITEWYLWNPSNRYTKDALLPQRDEQ